MRDSELRYSLKLDFLISKYNNIPELLYAKLDMQISILLLQNDDLDDLLFLQRLKLTRLRSLYNSRRQIDGCLIKPLLKPLILGFLNTLFAEYSKRGDITGELLCESPLYLKKNRQLRLQWALEHVEWTQEQWNSVLWSDETWITPRRHTRT